MKIEPKKHAEVDGIAREAVGSGLNDGSGRHAGGHVRAGPGDSGDCPGKQRQCEDKHHPADPASGHRGRHELQGQNPLQGKPGEHRERPRDRRPNMTLAVSAGSVMAGLVKTYASSLQGS